MTVISIFEQQKLCLTVTDGGANDSYFIDDSKMVPYSELQVTDGGETNFLL